MPFLLEVHHSLSILSILVSCLWAVIVLAAPRRAIGLGKVGRLIHFGAIAAAGLFGLTGFVLFATRIRLGSGLLLAALVTTHGTAGSCARLALAAGRKALAVRIALLQLALLAGAVSGLSGVSR